MLPVDDSGVGPDQTAPICFGSTLFVSILKSSVMLGSYLQQTTTTDDIFRCIYFLGALRVNGTMHTWVLFKDNRPRHICASMQFNQNLQRWRIYIVDVDFAPL